jgi:hypothetical protein
MRDLSLERRFREVAELDTIARRVNAGLLLDDVLEELFREAPGSPSRSEPPTVVRAVSPPMLWSAAFRSGTRTAARSAPS